MESHTPYMRFLVMRENIFYRLVYVIYAALVSVNHTKYIQLDLIRVLI